MGDAGESWVAKEDYAERNTFKTYGKKHRREYVACFDNLKLIVSLLNQHGGPGSFHVGFFRSEGEEVYRIGQTGVSHAHETRLYIHIDDKTRHVQVLTIGDKTTQGDDIRRCHRTARMLKGKDL